MDEQAIDLQFDRPHAARMYDYYLGGRTNFTADREAVGKVMAVFPAVLVAARANREFMHRSTRHLARCGLRQFLDIGSGIPTSPNLHEIAQGEAPDSAVVYIDNDPIVLAHAQALVTSTPEGRTAYAQADLTNPASILDCRAVRENLDLALPVAVSLNAVLHFVTDTDAAYTIVDELKNHLAPGSALVISHGTADFAPEAARAVREIYEHSGTGARPRSRVEFERFFAGWDLIEPGVTLTHRWLPEEQLLTDITDAEAACYGAVARKR